MNSSHLPPVLKGARVLLRPAQSSDKQDRFALGKHPEIVRMFGGHTRDLAPLDEEEVDVWYGLHERSPTAWMIEYDGRCIGSTRLHSFTDKSLCAVYAVGILDPSLLGRGLGSEVTDLVLAHAFNTLKLHRVSLRVLAYNTRAIRAYRKCGFKQEGIARKAAFVDGEWFDDVLMSVLAEEWREGR